MADKNYLTTLNTRPFMYEESKRVAVLLHQGDTYAEIEQQVVGENLFQLASKDRANRFFTEILKRLEELDIFLFNQFLATDEQTSKAILFYALLKRDRLLYEWMREVVWDKFLVLDWHLSKNETEAFFERKSKENKTVAGWTAETKQLLMDQYHRLLHDVDMGKIEGEEIQLQRIPINSEIRTYLIDRKETQIVEVLLGELIE